MALNLLEYKKTVQDPLQAAIIEELTEGQVMATIPFENITGSGVFYNREDTLPGVSFRGFNEAYAESTGVINPQSDPLKIFGGDLDVDKALIAMYGPSRRTSEERMKVKALRLTWEQTFIKGDSATNPRQFDGLQKRVTGSQLISNNVAGAALSLAKLDEAISQVEMPTHIIMSRRMRDRLTAASRNTATGGFVQFEQDEFGRKLPFYAGLPILIDSISNPILPFTETSPDGTSSTSCTSIYVVSFGDRMLTGIQNGDPQVNDLGEVQDKPVLRTRVEWLNGMAVYNGFSVARLAGITDAAVVV